MYSTMLKVEKMISLRIVGIVALLGISIAAGAQDNDLNSDSIASQPSATVIEEIVVTARKREESLMDVPESLTALSESIIERNGVDNLSDIGNLVPNMFMSVRADGLPNVTIRGIGAFGNTQGVGFYLDGVQLYSGATSRFGDLERVEVLRGPQGTLYGGSNIGGAVKFVSKMPDPEEFAGNVKLGVGGDNYYSGQASLNIPLSSDWAVRLFALGESDDSFLTNPNSPRLSGGVHNNGSPGKRDEIAARVILAGSITDRLSLRASVRYNDLDGPNNYWVRELNPDFTFPTTIDTTFNPRIERDTIASTLELVYNFDSFSAMSLTSVVDTDQARTVDFDLSQEYILSSVHDESFETVSQEFRLTSTGSGPFQWLAGVYFVNHEREELADILFGALLFNPTPTLAEEQAPQPSAPFRGYDNELEQTAGFANLSYRWDNIELAVGVRADRWKSSRNNFVSGFSGEQSDTEILSRGSLTYFFDDDSMVYVTFSQGFEPGGFNLTNFSGAGDLLAFGPEEANNYEIGYKGRLADGRANLTLAAFLIDYEDRQFELQVRDPITGDFVEGIINAGDSQQWGFEGELQWQLHENWILSGGFGYLNAEWENGTISPMNNADLSGLTPNHSPEWTGTTALSYDRNLNMDKKVFGRIQMKYKGDVTTNSQFLDTPGDDFPEWNNPSFTVLDLSLGMSWRTWELSLLLENILDEDYYIDSGEFPNFNPVIAQSAVIASTVERPRRLMATLRHEF